MENINAGNVSFTFNINTNQSGKSERVFIITEPFAIDEEFNIQTGEGNMGGKCNVYGEDILLPETEEVFIKNCDLEAYSQGIRLSKIGESIGWVWLSPVTCNFPISTGLGIGQEITIKAPKNY